MCLDCCGAIGLAAGLVSPACLWRGGGVHDQRPIPNNLRELTRKPQYRTGALDVEPVPCTSEARSAQGKRQLSPVGRIQAFVTGVLNLGAPKARESGSGRHAPPENLETWTVGDAPIQGFFYCGGGGGGGTFVQWKREPENLGVVLPPSPLPPAQIRFVNHTTTLLPYARHHIRLVIGGTCGCIPICCESK